MKLAEIKENPNNPRQISREKFERLKKSIKDFPQMMALRPIVIDETGMSLGGNMRKRALKALGYKEIPDEWVKKASELTDEQKKEFIIKDNNSFGEYDWDALANAWSDLPLTEWGVDLPDEWLTNGHKEEDESKVSELIDKAAELQQKWQVSTGQIWQIGRHRLMVGDCTEKANVEALCGDNRPDLLHTDPPYGISIVAVKNANPSVRVGGSKPFGSTSGTERRSSTGFDGPRGSVQRGPKSKNQIIQSNIYPVIEGDDKPFEPQEWLLNLAPIVILWGANYYADKLPVTSSWICWDKREAITRNTFADGELAWSSAGGPLRIFHHLWNGLHKGSQHGERRTHPTEKPVALFEEIGKMFADGGLWIDLYAGTGAQIVAAERSGATCYACEIEPLYCAVTLERMSALGLVPELIENGIKTESHAI